MKPAAAGSFAAQLKALREAAGFTQEELATIAGLSVHAVSALERGERRRPHVETVRALSAALDLPAQARDALTASARAPSHQAAVDELSHASLPLAPTVLLGREADVQMLRHWLADPAARLITLVGPGGVGKTRLALEVTRKLAEDESTRVVVVELAAIRQAPFVGLTIAEALGLSDVTAADLPRHVRAVCNREHPTLLVLDNFEQVLDAAPLVADLVTSATSLRVLATSRAPLRLRGERLYAVEPLGLHADSHDTMSPADVALVPAVRLFVERVRDTLKDFRLTPANAPTVIAICRRLDALPLALELAAPWLKTLTPEDLLHRLERDAGLPGLGARDLPERQQTMNGTVAWSYQLLNSNEQCAFRRFGVLPGLFSIETAASVLADREAPCEGSDQVLSAVAGLIDKSLLLRTETSVPRRPLYQMLETVRAYAVRELTKAGEREGALDGLARYCSREAALAGDGLMGPAQVEWLTRVRTDLDNYRSAMSWLIECGRPDEASDIASALRYFWMIRGHAAEGLRWYEQVLSMPSVSTAGESKALIGAAAMWFAQGEFERARTAVERALQLARGAGDPESVADAEYTFGHVERAAGNVSAARDWFNSSLVGFRALNIPSGAGKALTGMAAMALATGDAAEAERLTDEATSVLDNDGPWFLCFCLWIRAIVAVWRGSPDEAIAFVRESLTHIQMLQDKFAFVYALIPLAAAAALKGDDAWAARILGARDTVAERTGATSADNAVHGLREQVERDARRRLGPKRWAAAYAAGRKISIDGLLKDIDDRRPFVTS
jgi:predicted ATPase/DNA-binding XRE family transcriptional regulator